MTELKRPKDFCKDCWNEFWNVPNTNAGLWPPVRPTPHPGPRCVTHHRVFRKAQRLASAQRRDKSVYGLLPGGYEQLYRIQGGHCAICQRATGKTRRLSVDHDHASGAVRGLLCRPCNSLLGHLRDDPDAVRRILQYLLVPPALELERRFFEGD